MRARTHASISARFHTVQLSESLYGRGKPVLSEFLDHAHTVDADTFPHISRTSGKRIEGAAGIAWVLDCIMSTPVRSHQANGADDKYFLRCCPGIPGIATRYSFILLLMVLLSIFMSICAAFFQPRYLPSLA